MVLPCARGSPGSSPKLSRRLAEASWGSNIDSDLRKKDVFINRAGVKESEPCRALGELSCAGSALTVRV